MIFCLNRIHLPSEIATHIREKKAEEKKKNVKVYG